MNRAERKRIDKIVGKNGRLSEAQAAMAAMMVLSVETLASDFKFKTAKLNDYLTQVIRRYDEIAGDTDTIVSANEKLYEKLGIKVCLDNENAIKMRIDNSVVLDNYEKAQDRKRNKLLKVWNLYKKGKVDLDKIIKDVE